MYSLNFYACIDLFFFYLTFIANPSEAQTIQKEEVTLLPQENVSIKYRCLNEPLLLWRLFELLKQYELLPEL